MALKYPLEGSAVWAMEERECLELFVYWDRGKETSSAPRGRLCKEPMALEPKGCNLVQFLGQVVSL